MLPSTFRWGKQRVTLEHHVHRPPVRRHVDDILAVEQDVAFTRGLETREHAQEGGFAAARGAEQREEFALCDVERQRFYRSDRTEALADALESHQRRLLLSCRALRHFSAVRHRFPVCAANTLAGGAYTLNPA